jgi:hypothetical protein
MERSQIWRFKVAGGSTVSLKYERLAPVCLIACVFGASFAVPARAQSLAELAQKTKEAREKAEADRAKAAAEASAKCPSDAGRQSAAPKSPACEPSKPAPPKKTYNDDSLKQLAPSADTSSALPVPPSTDTSTKESAIKASSKEGSSKASAENADQPIKDEAYWRERMATLRGNLARDNAACVPIAQKVNELDALYADSIFYIDGKAMVNRASAAVIETKQVEANAELRECRAKVALDQKAIDAAEEEARRLGVLPGWLR